MSVGTDRSAVPAGASGIQDENQTPQVSHEARLAGAAKDSRSGDGPGNRIQVIIAVLGAMAAIIPAALGIMATRAEPGAPTISTGNLQGIPAQDSKESTLSPAAAALVDEQSKVCLGSDPEPAEGDAVSIVSPSAGADVEVRPVVSGKVKLEPAENLYFFSYADGICYYYFDPYGPVVPNRDGSWKVNPNVEANAGGTITFVAAVVGPEGHALLGEILKASTESGEDPYLLHLPTGTRLTHVTVNVRRAD